MLDRIDQCFFQRKAHAEHVAHGILQALEPGDDAFLHRLSRLGIAGNDDLELFVNRHDEYLQPV